MAIDKILVPVDFSACSNAALDYALTVADQCGAEVEVLHVWCPRDREEEAPTSEIFADTPEGIAMEKLLSAAEWKHPAKVSGRLEFGEDPSVVILTLLERERFDLVVLGNGTGHIAIAVATTTACRVVTIGPNENEAA